MKKTPSHFTVHVEIEQQISFWVTTVIVVFIHAQGPFHGEEMCPKEDSICLGHRKQIRLGLKVQTLVYSDEHRYSHRRRLGSATDNSGTIDAQQHTHKHALSGMHQYIQYTLQKHRQDYRQTQVQLTQKGCLNYFRLKQFWLNTLILYVQGGFMPWSTPQGSPRPRGSKQAQRASIRTIRPVSPRRVWSRVYTLVPEKFLMHGTNVYPCCPACLS